MSLKNSLINITEFCKIMKIENISNKVIIKLYRLLRNIIKKNYHLMWIREPLALEPAEEGYRHQEGRPLRYLGSLCRRTSSGSYRADNQVHDLYGGYAQGLRGSDPVRRGD